MMTNENIEDTLNNEGMPVPNVWVELEGEFLDFDKDNQTLKCKFPVRDRYLKPVGPSVEYVTAVAWRDSIDGRNSLYKGELYLDNGELAAVAESEFVEIRKS